MKSSLVHGLVSGLSALQLASARYVMYFDQYHITDLPNRTVTAGINHCITAFANSSLFTTSPAGNYTPFESLETTRARFDDGTKVMIAIGGWGDTAGFGEGAASEESRTLWASNVAAMLDEYGFDGVDIDWEYPGGNGADYKQNPNSGKTSEIQTFPLLLAAVRAAIGPEKLLSIAVPGLQRDMIAYTAEQAPEIWESVDFVNVMTYDLMNRRDNITKHHTDVEGSLMAIDYYINELALPASKANLGFANYAKWFKVDNATQPCDTGLGCMTVLLEDVNGTDTGMSGAVTFERSNYAAPSGNLTESPDATCGGSTGYKCKEGECCSAYGYCGTTEQHCGLNCLADFGTCSGTSIVTSFRTAMANGVEDQVKGGEYYYDKDNAVFWTWDTPALIAVKFVEIVKDKGLGGVMAEDSWDWSHILALQKGASENGL